MISLPPRLRGEGRKGGAGTVIAPPPGRPPLKTVDPSDSRKQAANMKASVPLAPWHTSFACEQPRGAGTQMFSLPEGNRRGSRNATRQKVRIDPFLIKWRRISGLRIVCVLLCAITIIFSLLLIGTQDEKMIVNGPSLDSAKRFILDRQRESGWQVTAERGSSFDVGCIPYRLRFILWARGLFGHSRQDTFQTLAWSDVFDMSKDTKFMRIAAEIKDEKIKKKRKGVSP